MVRKSVDVRFKWSEIQMIWLSNDLRFKWVRCQLIWGSSELVVNWFELQVIWLSIDVCFEWFWLSVELNFKWGGCQLIWDSKLFWETSVKIETLKLKNKAFLRDLLQKLKLWNSKTKLLYETSFENEALKIKSEAFLRDFLQNWNFEDQKRSISARLPSKMKLWSSKTKLLCETSFENESLKIKNAAFPRDFLQKWRFEDQKRSISARLPSKMKLWRSKTKLFCETSFKNKAWKIKNEAFLRDFLQKWSFEDQKQNFSARRPSKMKLWRSKTKHFCETSFKIDMSTRHLTSEFQYVLTIFKWMLQKYRACHEKVEPRHTKSCNCHAKWSLKSSTSVTWHLQRFHRFCVGGFKHGHHKARSHCACHAKRIVSEPLQIHHACQRFCNPHELLRLPRILQTIEFPAPAPRKHLWASKSVPRPSVFNDFDFQIALARTRGANFPELNFQKCSKHAAWCLFSRMRSEGSRFIWRSGGEAVFAKFCVCVRNRRQPSATVCGDAVRLSTVASAPGVVPKGCQVDSWSPQLYWCLQSRCLWEWSASQLY